jgi:hypothetical protein
MIKIIKGLKGRPVTDKSHNEKTKPWKKSFVSNTY